MNFHKKISKIILFSVFFILFSCNHAYEKKAADAKDFFSGDTSQNEDNKRNLLTDFVPLFKDGDINVAVEIPAGSLEKWEVDKTNGQVKLEYVNGKPRIIKYLGYPGNYGMIPGTILPKELAGDGDPLDVIVLGPPVERGSLVKCKVLGVLYLLDRGEKDDKLIAVSETSPLYFVDSLDELNENYSGITEILNLWFINYKGPGKMISKGFGDKKMAHSILASAIKEYQNRKNLQNDE